MPLDDVLRRLKALGRQSLTLDREQVREALSRHFAALGLERPPITWVEDAPQGQVRTFAPLVGAQSLQGWRDAELRALRGVGRLISYSLWTDPLEIDRRPSIDPLRDALRDAAWSVLESRALAESLRSDLSWFDVDPRWRHPRSAALCGSLAAAWRPGMRKHVPVWEPFLDACAAGLWIFWVVEGGIVAVPRPVIRGLQDRLHADSGPAVQWLGGSGWYYWRGVRVPREVIEEPGAITLASISDEENLEVRRVMVERYGHARFLSDLGAKPLASDDFGTLYRVEFADDEPLTLVKVVNSTPEPDGSRKEYFLRVPPDMRSAREAVAWTFGVLAHRYSPAVQT